MVFVDRLVDIAAVGASLAALIGYESRLRVLARRSPERVARTAHARMREAWVQALAAQPGSEILAVQAVRNSLMSSTIIASTAALALMGALSLGAPMVRHPLPTPGVVPVRGVLLLALLATLFASFVASALAMRLFNHASYMLSYPVGSALRIQLTPTAAAYVRRAGHHYGWSLRLLFLVAPLAAGILLPPLTLPATVGLIAALRLFDRAPQPTDAVDLPSRGAR